MRITLVGNRAKLLADTLRDAKVPNDVYTISENLLTGHDELSKQLEQTDLVIISEFFPKQECLLSRDCVAANNIVNLNIVNALKQCSHKLRVAFISSCYVYGNAKQTPEEGRVCLDNWQSDAYAYEKLLAESMYLSLTNHDTKVYRLFDMVRSYLIEILELADKNDPRLSAYLADNTLVHLCSDYDLSRAIMLTSYIEPSETATSETPVTVPKIFNVGFNQALTVHDVASYALKRFNHPCDYQGATRQNISLIQPRLNNKLLKGHIKKYKGRYTDIWQDTHKTPYTNEEVVMML